MIGEPLVDPDPEPDGGGEGGEDGEGTPPEDEPQQALEVLLLGSNQLGLVQPDLEGFLRDDSRIEPAITRFLAADWRSLQEDEGLCK